MDSMTHAQRTQMAYLGAALMDADAAHDSVMRLMPIFFDDGPLRQIFTAIFKMVFAGEAVDVVTVIAQVGDDKKTLIAQMAETCPSISHIDDYEALIVEDYCKKILTAGLYELATSTDTSDVLCVKMQKMMDRQQSIQVSHTDASARAFDAVLDETILDLSKPDKSFKFGWRAMDRFGMTEPCNTVVIAGRPGCGKTDFAINLAARLSKKYKVYYLTMEETDKKLMQRMLSKVTRIDASRIRDRKLTYEEIGSVENVAAALKNRHNLIMDSGGNVTIDGIRAKLLRQKPQIAFIDHIGLIAPSDQRQKEYDRISEATRQLKLMAMQMGILIFEISQMNRSSTRDGNRFGSLADLRGSGTIEQDANAVIFVQNSPAQSEMLYGEESYRESGIFVAKNRDGPLGIVNMRWQPQYHDWRPADDDWQPVEADPFISSAPAVQMEFGGK